VSEWLQRYLGNTQEIWIKGRAPSTHKIRTWPVMGKSNYGLETLVQDKLKKEPELTDTRPVLRQYPASFQNVWRSRSLAFGEVVGDSVLASYIGTCTYFIVGCASRGDWIFFYSIATSGCWRYLALLNRGSGIVLHSWYYFYRIWYSFDRGLFSGGCAPDPLLCHVSILSSNTLYFTRLGRRARLRSSRRFIFLFLKRFLNTYSLTTDYLNYDPVKRYLFLVLLKPLKEKL